MGVPCWSRCRGERTFHLLWPGTGRFWNARHWRPPLVMPPFGQTPLSKQHGSVNIRPRHKSLKNDKPKYLRAERSSLFPCETPAKRAALFLGWSLVTVSLFSRCMLAVYSQQTKSSHASNLARKSPKSRDIAQCRFSMHTLPSQQHMIYISLHWKLTRHSKVRQSISSISEWSRIPRPSVIQIMWFLLSAEALRTLSCENCWKSPNKDTHMSVMSGLCVQVHLSDCKHTCLGTLSRDTPFYWESRYVF